MTKTMTTTAFRIDLICPCIGMKRFTSHSTTPAATIVIRTVVSGISSAPILFSSPVYPHGVTRSFKHSGRIAFLLPTRLPLVGSLVREGYRGVNKRQADVEPCPSCRLLRDKRQTGPLSMGSRTEEKNDDSYSASFSFFQGHAEIAELLCSPRRDCSLVKSPGCARRYCF